mmetsp:Transcript_101434/g.201498  ORF Transcript_101434/g.201498 Transcript_101434/m.201498 type:complete len:82 (-) Transcript_101434:215-460(-)
MFGGWVDDRACLRRPAELAAKSVAYFRPDSNRPAKDERFFFFVRKTAAPRKSPSSEDNHPLRLPNSSAHRHRGGVETVQKR